jgi:4-hydroxybenzoate polyprenyltransferase
VETPFDWITVAIFAGLAVLFLQRSSMERPVDSIPMYFPPALGCALANWLGNKDYILPAVALCVAVLAYIYFVLKPFTKP